MSNAYVFGLFFFSRRTTMAVKTHMALFVERFVKFNKSRYANDPEYLALFEGLKESDLQLGPVNDPGDGTRNMTIASAGRNFRCDPLQSWTPADASKTLGLYILKNVTPLADINTLEMQTEAGLYSYMDGAITRVGVVIASNVAAGSEPAAIAAAVNAALKYAIPTILTTPGDTFVQLIGFTYTGNLEWVKGAVAIRVIPPTDYGVLGTDPNAPVV
jgi:hypothetical protein